MRTPYGMRSYVEFRHSECTMQYTGMTVKLNTTVIRSDSDSFDLEKNALGKIIDGNTLKSCCYIL